MSNLFSNIEIGRSALMAQRIGVQVAGGNIANAETDGYSRRSIELRADSVQAGDVSIRGVSIDNIRRVESPFLSALHRNELGALGQLETYSNGLENLESIFYVPGEASNSTLSNATDEFWGSFNDLANNPESLEMRNILRERGQFLVNTFNDFFDKLEVFRKKLRETIKMKVEEINNIAEKIADLNTKIIIGEEADSGTSGLRDKRDHLVDQLSRSINTKASVTRDGMLSINVGRKMLVHADSYNKLEVKLEKDDSDPMAWSTDSNSGYDIIQSVKLQDSEETLAIESGELKGLIDLSDSVINEYLRGFDQLAAGLVENVNELHKQGIAIDGSTDNNFFLPDLSGDDSSIDGMAGRIKVSEEIVEDPKKIAASSGEGEIGNGQIAAEIVNLREQFTMKSDTVTFDEYFQGMVSQVGIQTQKAAEDLEVQDQMVKQLEQRKDSLTGVSLDDEAVNLIKFQKSYQAAAKYISIIDNMLDTLINKM